MARIRTIKPEFFTSEDIVSLSAFARLLYISLWCEADRDGRMQWKPRTFKMRYFPADDIDIHELCQEVLDAGLVELYGDGLAYIPKFSQHQHINPRETASTLPDPHASSRVEHASARVQSPSVTHREEGKGRERKVNPLTSFGGAGGGDDGMDDADALDASPSAPPADEPEKSKRASRLPADWRLPKAWGEWALGEKPSWTPEHVRKVSESFRDFWHAKAGRDAAKLDWEATWRIWVRKEPDLRAVPSLTSGYDAEAHERQRASLFRGAL